MYDENSTVDWMTGFAKEAASLGLSPEETQDLLITTQRMTLASKQSDVYTEAYDQVIKEAGMEKDAILPLLGGLAALGYGGYKAYRGMRGHFDPMWAENQALQRSAKTQSGYEQKELVNQALRDKIEASRKRTAAAGMSKKWHDAVNPKPVNSGAYPYAPPRRYYAPRGYAY